MIAALDATKDPDIASRYSIKGYPTVKYFENGELKFDLDLRESAQLVEFMRDPKEPPAPPPAEGPWADEQSEVVHLNEETFKPFLKKKKHVLVMFYAPCKYPFFFCTHEVLIWKSYCIFYSLRFNTKIFRFLFVLIILTTSSKLIAILILRNNLVNF